MKVSVAYRNLMKAVKKHIAKDEAKMHFKDYVTEEFRKPLLPHQEKNLSAFISHRIKLANDYTFHLNSVQHHKELLFSYNIAVDRTDEMKKVLGKSAASVGLRLPEVYKD